MAWAPVTWLISGVTRGSTCMCTKPLHGLARPARAAGSRSPRGWRGPELSFHLRGGAVAGLIFLSAGRLRAPAYYFVRAGCIFQARIVDKNNGTQWMSLFKLNLTYLLPVYSLYEHCVLTKTSKGISSIYAYALHDYMSRINMNAFVFKLTFIINKYVSRTKPPLYMPMDE